MMKQLSSVMAKQICVHFRNKEFAKDILGKIKHLLPYSVSEYSEIQSGNGVIIMLCSGIVVTNADAYTHNYNVWNQTKFERFIENNCKTE